MAVPAAVRGGPSAAASMPQARVLLPRRESLLSHAGNLRLRSSLRHAADAAYSVAGVQNLDVMAFVPGDHEGNRAYTDGLAARGAAAAPGVCVEGAQQREGRGSRGAEVSNEIGERPRVELGDGHRARPVESGRGGQ